MSRDLARRLVAACMALVTAFLMIPPKPTVLVVCVGMSYDEVVKRSSYPALDNGMAPTADTGFATIDVTKPSVIVKYADPQHGFELPPTKFVAVTFGDSIAESVSTSPMLNASRFPEAVELLAQLQERFKAAGWVPWKENKSVWWDFSPEGRKALHARLMRFSDDEQWLVIPNRRVGMIFRIKCVDDCDDDDDARFLIDVGVGDAVGDIQAPD